MKKIILYVTILSCCVFTSCETDDTAGVSDVTNYAVFDLSGPSEVLLHKGEDYTEPGAAATEAGEPVDVTSSFSSGLFRGGSFDDGMTDIYSVIYSAVNQDGYAATASRSVIVADNGDLKTDLSGLYRATIERNGSLRFTDLEYVLIWQVDDNTYQISDAIGGYYMFGAGYGINYAAQGMTITVNGENDFTFGDPIPVGAFGGSLAMKEMTVDPAAKTIDFTSDWNPSYPYVFKVHLEQVQF